ncbi:MAG: RsmB/NOP family class I SAM-dependent RNA methyltransferase [Myxococcota bacterium]
MSAGRVAAARALVAVDSGSHVEDVLARSAPADPRDRAHAWFLAMGVLRHRGQVDAALRAHVSQPIGGLDAEVRAALRLGCFEKLFGRAGDHAAVNEAVEVVKALGSGRAKGLVNAVLRRVQAVENLPPHDALNHPAWLMSRWVDRYGQEATHAWCQSNSEPAPLAVVDNGLDPQWIDAMRDAGLNPTAVELAGGPLRGVWRIDGSDGGVPELPGFHDGAFWVQDPSAVAVADLVGAKAGDRVLDACAAPGGKTFRLLSSGAVVTAVDSQGNRLPRLREGLARLQRQATVRHHDWTQGELPDVDPFDAVLVDAPCTGLGTVRRHPEIRWRRQISDILSMPLVQGPILQSASRHVRPGGVLVYAVCSPEPEEGSAIVTGFLAKNADFSLERELNFAPPKNHEDAHYAARLVRS